MTPSDNSMQLTTSSGRGKRARHRSWAPEACMSDPDDCCASCNSVRTELQIRRWQLAENTVLNRRSMTL
jgi:hypothetical protein